MKISKAEQWNIEVLLPLFEHYRRANGMTENPERTLTFLTNRIRFNESLFFIAVDEQDVDKQDKAVGFIQLYPRLSSLQLHRYLRNKSSPTSGNLCGVNLQSERFRTLYPVKPPRRRIRTSPT